MSVGTIQNAVIAENVPQVLKDQPQWVCWHYEMDKDGRTLKVPYDAKNNRKASSTDPTTWTSFEQAIETFESSETYNGVGYVFSKDDPFGGIDLDDCRYGDGSLAPWAQKIVDLFASYTEISPSENGVKIFFRGRKPQFAGCAVKNIAGNEPGELEVYDQARYFCVTGNIYPGSVTEVTDCQPQLDELCRRYWGKQLTPPTSIPPVPVDTRMADCLRDMLAIQRNDNFDGSFRLYACCCRCVEYDLGDRDAVSLIQTYAGLKPFPKNWSDGDILRRLRDAEKKAQRGAALLGHRVDGTGTKSAGEIESATPEYKSIRQLMVQYPHLRPPVIHGLLRQGETMNVIAPPKTGKSWLVTDLAIAIATGRPWLELFQTVQGNVLIIDNELHGETSANRVPRVAEARNIDIEQIADSVFVENLRGHLKDLISLGPYFGAIEPGKFRIIILDAFYRFIPKDTDENDNGSVAQLYNHLDHYANKLGCSFVLIHHASKGSQSNKSVTDVGAGAGSQSRATDTHLILRAHEEDKAVVLDAAVRSWQPVSPVCLRWDFPVFNPAPDLDPTTLRPERPRRKAKELNNEPPAPKLQWDTDMFVKTCVSDEGQVKDRLLDIAMNNGLSKARAKQLMGMAEGEKKVYRWVLGPNKPVKFATVPQPLIETPKPSRKRKRK